MHEEVKMRLKNYKMKVAKKNEMELRIKELEEEAGISAMAQAEKTSKTYKITKAVENQAIELADKKEKLKRFINQYKIEIDHIENALSVLTEEERKVIDLVFIQGRRKDSVAYIMDKCVRTINYYISTGLKKMNELLKDDFEDCI
ncbi:hypothetical protein [Clostridium butyricum]|uniref:Uncharacterized protein n=1 Tax=Clostridium butyricum E4 str. BoNT E BL5262 TaxID=632245 RepID=C4IFD4_CLOBU|nr:hypothetical protein [Clostridium butyricum]EEP52909.1 conserved hypothetical protein [Clostridium butyricum E4 str. BoNT E BL5262]NFL32876.1 RNA polymerase subunit sigma-24 [Clostridium butyricum]NFS20250.1 RNA polymerase subunit sigma-24 [Clostridium butyricum]